MIIFHFLLACFVIIAFAILFTFIGFNILAFILAIYRYITKKTSPKPYKKHRFVKLAMLILIAINTVLYIQEYDRQEYDNTDIFLILAYLIYAFIRVHIATFAILISIVLGLFSIKKINDKFPNLKYIIKSKLKSLYTNIFILLVLMVSIVIIVPVYWDNIVSVCRKITCTEKLTKDQLLRRALIDYWEDYRQTKLEEHHGFDLHSIPSEYYILSNKVDTFENLKKVLQKNPYAWDKLRISIITKWVGSNWYNKKHINDFKDVKVNNGRLNYPIKYRGDDRYYPVDCCKVYEKNNKYFIEIKYIDDWFHQLGIGRKNREEKSYLKHKTETCMISGCGDILKSTCVVKK